MKPRNAVILVAIGIATLGGGWVLSRPPSGQDQSAIAPGSPAFPDLASKLASAEKIEIRHGGSGLEIVRQGDRWVLPGKGHYPVSPGHAREFLNGLADLKLAEPRTSDPAEYNRLGVEDATSPTATSTLVRVLGSADAPIAALLVGHQRTRMQGNVPDNVYVRRPGEAQSWLAEGHLTTDADPQQWVERDILSIPADKVASIAVALPDGALEFGRADGKKVVVAPADHPKIDDDKIDDAFRALENVSLTDVKPAAQQSGDKAGTSTFTLTDGEKIVITLFRSGAGDKAELWAQFAASGEAAAKAEADKLESRVNGWTYQLGTWKEAGLLPSLDSLKAAPPSPTPAPGAGAMPPGMQIPGMPPGMPPATPMPGSPDVPK